MMMLNQLWVDQLSKKKAPEPKPEPKQTKTEAIELLAGAEDFSNFLVGAWNRVSKDE